MLATKVMMRIVAVSMSEAEPKYIVTPLAGACFSKDDIPSIARVYNDCSEVDVLKKMMASSISGGHELKESCPHMAVAMAMNATRNVKDEKIGMSIVSRIIRQYNAVKKPPNPEFVQILSRYAHGGVPSHLSYDRFKKAFEFGQAQGPENISARAAADAAKDSEMQSGFGSIPKPTTPLKSSRKPDFSGRSEASPKKLKAVPETGTSGSQGERVRRDTDEPMDDE